jgi:putative transposase
MRRACGVIGLSRTSFAYTPIVKPDEEAIRKRLKELAQERRRFGYRRLHVMLQREGFVINHKRTERLYRAEALNLNIRRRKKLASLLRTEIPKPTHRNHIWSMDFMRDALANGRTIKVLPIVDEYTRKCFRIEVDTSINGARVVRVLDEIGQREGLPVRSSSSIMGQSSSGRHSMRGHTRGGSNSRLSRRAGRLRTLISRASTASLGMSA